MISRAGVLSNFQRPSSRLSLRAAKSNRALWASQGLISWSRVTVCAASAILFSNSFVNTERTTGEGHRSFDAFGRHPDRYNYLPIHTLGPRKQLKIQPAVVIGSNPCESRPAR